MAIRQKEPADQMMYRSQPEMSVLPTLCLLTAGSCRPLDQQLSNAMLTIEKVQMVVYQSITSSDPEPSYMPGLRLVLAEDTALAQLRASRQADMGHKIECSGTAQAHKTRSDVAGVSPRQLHLASSTDTGSCRGAAFERLEGDLQHAGLPGSLALCPVVGTGVLFHRVLQVAAGSLAVRSGLAALLVPLLHQLRLDLTLLQKGHHQLWDAWPPANRMRGRPFLVGLMGPSPDSRVKRQVNGQVSMQRCSMHSSNLGHGAS